MIIISSRELLKFKLNPDNYDFLARTTDEQGDVFSFIDRYADDFKDMDLQNFKNFVIECSQLYQAGFFGDRWSEMGKKLIQYTMSKKVAFVFGEKLMKKNATFETAHSSLVFSRIAKRRLSRKADWKKDPSHPQHKWVGILEEERKAPVQKRSLTQEDIKKLLLEAKSDPHLAKVLRDLGIIG